MAQVETKTQSQQPADMQVVTKKFVVVNDRSYELQNELGRGKLSKVYQVLDAEKNYLAVKVVDLEGQDEYVVKAYLNEVQLLKKLQHVPYVIKMFDHQYVEEERKIYVVMQMGDMDLGKVFSTFVNDADKIAKVKVYWCGMLGAIRALHDEGLVHSKLRPTSFVLVAGEAKLIDIFPTSKTSPVASWDFMSPEAVQNASGFASVKLPINQKTDVWSLGMIHYFLIYGKTPFEHITDPREKLNAIVNPQYQIEFGNVRVIVGFGVVLSFGYSSSGFQNVIGKST